MYRDDWLERQLVQIAAAVSRITRMRGKDESGVVAEAETGWEILGIRRELAVVIDTTTLAGMLGTPAKMLAAADLMTAEGFVERATELRRLAVLKSGLT